MAYDEDPANFSGTPLDELEAGWSAAEPLELDPEAMILNQPLFPPKPLWWARSTLEERRLGLTYTIAFTEWVIAVWRWEKKLLPPCWVRHPDIVVEMEALAMAHHAMHTPDNLAGPAQWLLYLDYQRRRLGENNAASGCAERKFHELHGSTEQLTAQRLRNYGESDDLNPELPLAVAAWTWPHHHPEPATPPATTTSETRGES